jgi:hypothetical protein
VDLIWMLTMYGVPVAHLLLHGSFLCMFCQHPLGLSLLPCGGPWCLIGGSCKSRKLCI